MLFESNSPDPAEVAQTDQYEARFTETANACSSLGFSYSDSIIVPYVDTWLQTGLLPLALAPDTQEQAVQAVEVDIARNRQAVHTDSVVDAEYLDMLERGLKKYLLDPDERARILVLRERALRLMPFSNGI